MKYTHFYRIIVPVLQPRGYGGGQLLPSLWYGINISRCIYSDILTGEDSVENLYGGVLSHRDYILE
ncbi:MAG: hypothetical protein ACUVXA_19190 [Candidatus Jordarchaeum sp.]|uniref:hypothetical protein n=1 Tax=Candidatus Jordarchaeum sp. TaxID=2823881 RepID=UPI00404B9E10